MFTVRPLETEEQKRMWAIEQAILSLKSDHFPLLAKEVLGRASAYMSYVNHSNKLTPDEILNVEREFKVK